MSKGIKTGGRTKGTRNKATLAHIAHANEAAKDGISPLEVMLKTMRLLWAEAIAVDQAGKETVNEEKAIQAVEIAKVAAPFVHPRLNSIEGVLDKPLIVESPDNMLEQARRLAFVITMGAREAAKKGAPVLKALTRSKKKVPA